MTRELTFVVPGKVVGKGRPRFARVGQVGMRAYTPAATKAEETRVGYLARAALGGLGPITGAVAVRIAASCCPPASWSRRKRALALAGGLSPTTKPDIDNVAKLVLDGLNGVAFVDDSQIVDLTASKRFGTDEHVAVWVREIAQEHATA